MVKPTFRASYIENGRVRWNFELNARDEDHAIKLVKRRLKGIVDSMFINEAAERWTYYEKIS